MSKKKFFKNKTQQGDFGEYLYIKFCKKNNIDFDRVNRLGRDIHLANAKIDVKTTFNQNSKNWSDKKYKPYVKYDVIFIDIDNDSVYLYPEKDSPLRKDFYEVRLGKFTDLYDEWKTSQYERQVKFDPIEEEKKEIEEKITQKYKLRYIYRVLTHDWHGDHQHPFNIPGSCWQKYDATIYLKIMFDWEKDKIGKIKYYIFLTNEMGQYPKLESPKLAANRGYEKIINWQVFEENFSKNIFHDKKDLTDFINSRQL